MKFSDTRFLISIRNERTSVYSIIGWMIILSISGYFIYTNALRYFDFSNPVYTTGPTGNKPFAPVLITHITFGMIALLIGPFQFFSAIRKKYPRTHRITGRVYLVSIIIAGVTATYLAIAHNLIVDKAFVFGIGILGLALSWFVTAGMAFWAIKKRNFLQHQEWMIRSYVVTSGFTFFRLIFYSLNGIENFPTKEDLGGITAWACWAIPLLVTEVILQAKKIYKSSKKPQVHQPV